MTTTAFATIEEALEELRQGRMVILVDDEKRENEGDLVCIAETITPEQINFMAMHGRGLICLTLQEEDLARLHIPMMVNPESNTSPFGTAFTVSIEAASGVTTGISACDRARTIRVAVDSKSTHQDIAMPGHVFPLRAKSGGVLMRPGQTEGSVDLARLAGFKPAGVLCEVINDDGTMSRLPELIKFAEKHHLKIISIHDLIVYRMRHEQLMQELSEARLPLAIPGDFRIKIFADSIHQQELIALVSGDLALEKPVLVRLHSECFTGDIFGSARCDCGWQLQASLARIGQEGGVLLYLPQEGRGIGLANKIKSYALQDQGLDTVEANHELGFSADHRDYGMAAQVLRYLGIQQVRLLTNNPSKIKGIEMYGIEVAAREAIEMSPTDTNLAYLKAKQQKLGHLLNL